MPVLVCEAQGCFEPLPPKAHRYHSKQCQKRESQRRWRDRKRTKDIVKSARTGTPNKDVNRERLSREQSVDGRASHRRGPKYEEFCETDLPERLAAGDITQPEAAAEFGTTQASISRWMASWALDREIEHERARWTAPEEATASLEDFERFRARYFRVPNAKGHVLKGRPYETPRFQKRWIDAVMTAMRDGGKVQILAPPRHGKSELLAHFCIWMICRNANIRIVWVGLSGQIAAQSVDQVKDELDNNEALKADFCGPGADFRPLHRSGLPWSSGRFTIGTRTVSGIKSPTMIAIGRGSGALSRDADLIVCDDIIDQEAADSPAQRDKDSRWLRTQIVTRMEPQTALMVIGSRQHHEDLYGELHGQPGWAHIVDTAHDDTACDVGHQRCVLFPSLRPFAWLEEQRAQLRELYEMVYLNRPRAEGVAVFTREPIEACFNHFRLIGPGGVPPGNRLIAGLDPAAVGHQAAFLWAVDVTTGKRSMVDLELQPGGGIPGARSLVKAWNERYSLKHWVIERNSQQQAWLQDEQLRSYCADQGIRVDPHHTSPSNKWDKSMGVSSLADLFREDLIDLPTGDMESREKVMQFVRQLLSWDGDHKRTKVKSDLVMAAWFPETQIRAWRTEWTSDAAQDYENEDYAWNTVHEWYEEAGVA